jgi:hypothetical protein
MPDAAGNFKGISIRRAIPWHLGECDGCGLKIPNSALAQVTVVEPVTRREVAVLRCPACFPRP